MKKLYAIISVAVAMTSLSAGAIELPMLQLKQSEPLSVDARHTLDGKTIVNCPDKAPARVNDDPEIPTVHPTGEYKSLGTGTYYEDIFTFWGAASQLFWEVEIEESVDQPGWYRLRPYSMKNPVTDAIGKVDDTYMYINATDPDKVWMEDLILYDGQYIFSQNVPECDWPEQYSFYGRYEDGVLDFSDAWIMTCVYGSSEDDFQWFHADSGCMKITLPGIKLPDYTLNAVSEFCARDNKPWVGFEVGTDVAALYAATAPGIMEIDADNAKFIIENGNKLNIGTGEFTIEGLEKNGRGLYTVCLVAADADGNAVNSNTVAVFIELDDAENWEPYGRGFWQEGIVSPHIDGLTMTQVNVDIEQHKTIKGYYRLVNPYKEHKDLSPYLINDAAHNHYIYVNATDPDYVYLEASEIGLETPNGQSAVWSYVGMRLAQGYTLEDLKGYGFFGYLEDGVISFPDDMLLYAEPGYFGGRFVTSGDRVKIYLDRTIPGSGIEDVESDSASPVEYYNLQGIRVDNPANGVYIRRQGKNVTKQHIR